MATDTTNPKNRVKVELKQGHHLADWVRLNGSMQRGNGSRRISKQELNKHNTKVDAWTAYDGRVYNITQYLSYHPGGEKILMQSVGKDCTVLFNKHHRWVNGHAMLSNCLIGAYIGEGSDLNGESSSLPIPTTKKPEPIQKSSGDSVDPVVSSQLVSQVLAQLELQEGDKGEDTSIKDVKVQSSSQSSAIQSAESNANISKNSNDKCNVV